MRAKGLERFSFKNSNIISKSSNEQSVKIFEQIRDADRNAVKDKGLRYRFILANNARAILSPIITYINISHGIPKDAVISEE